MLSLSDALQQPNASQRLKAAMDAGSRPSADFVPLLVARCAVEPDFNVREMLTWALVRHPAELTVPLVVEQLSSVIAQARSQALHTLSKIGDVSAWPAITSDLLFDADDDVARTAWRAAAILAPDAEKPELAAKLATLLGRGERDTRFSLSRALVALAPFSDGVLASAAASGELETRVHAVATQRLVADPEESFETAVYEARASLAG